jgi:hypothetical protein
LDKGKIMATYTGDFHEYWLHKGHIYGQCYLEPNAKLVYVNIPKNASSWTKQHIPNWQCVNYFKQSTTDWKYIVVLRDPIERWISGIVQYFFEYNIDPDFNNTAFCNLIFDRIAFDDHTERQILFIQDIPIEKTTFIKCDKSYSTNFIDLMRSNGIDIKNEIIQVNTITQNAKKIELKELILARLKLNTSYEESLRKYYERDYELFNWVQFFNSAT